jgi:hypothetical protein
MRGRVLSVWLMIVLGGGSMLGGRGGWFLCMVLMGGS